MAAAHPGLRLRLAREQGLSLSDVAKGIDRHESLLEAGLEVSLAEALVSCSEDKTCTDVH